jgi:CheY-like chemotaxis protein
MALESHLDNDPSVVPPIVLLVEDDEDTRDMYSLYLESAGLWVATAPNPGAAAETVAELKPDVIVTDLSFGGRPAGLEFAQALKHDVVTAHVPVIVLSGRPAREVGGPTLADVDVLLLKPVVPDELRQQIADVLVRSRELRRRNQTALDRAAGLLQKSDALLAKSREIEQRRNVSERRCPSCARALQWLETGRIDGVEYDYYHWCDRGCGLYCYDLAGRRWVKLAG